MARRGRGTLTFNREAWDSIRKQPSVDDFVLQMAVDARDAAEHWAEGHHMGQPGPHFKVVKEKGEHRARYTVRPATAAATGLVMKYPADFQACLEAARRNRP